MKLSAIIPAIYPTEELKKLTKKCIDSLKGKVDEIVLVESGIEEWGKMELNDADICIECQARLSFTEAVNIGVEASTGDFVAIVNNDTEFLEGDIERLCKEGNLMYPMIRRDKKNWAAFFVLSRKIWDKVNGFDENFTFYYGDEDLAMKLSKIGIEPKKDSSIIVKHSKSRTVSELNNEKYKEQIKESKGYFKKKWKKKD